HLRDLGRLAGRSLQRCRCRRDHWPVPQWLHLRALRLPLDRHWCADAADRLHHHLLHGPEH
ncbi:hypothetical protein BN1708_018889, partial [Verticillium longisporum]